MGTYYLTTPIYYVNGKPHIGHAYTTIVADTLARFYRLRGDTVLFLTGTDEHGEKVEEAARVAGYENPKDFTDTIVPTFTDLWKTLQITYDDFIRTTDSRHEEAVRAFAQVLYDRGDIYESEYEGWFCMPCETFWTKTQVTEPVCPDCKRPLERLKERNFFFRMSRYQQWLIDHITAHPEFVRPVSRRNEVLGFLAEPLQDLCISRPLQRLRWGITLPFGAGHVMYVWFDALINYISALGYGTDRARFDTFWPADVHLIGKDIIRHHAVYWPIMLHAAGIVPPRVIFAHGWWVNKGDKMSKSKGNVIDPVTLVRQYGIDAFRYFLMREVSLGLDGTFSEELLIGRINSDLANDLGNLLHRTLTMVEKYFAGTVPACTRAHQPLCGMINALAGAYEQRMRAFDLCGALTDIWAIIGAANKFIEQTAPWKLHKAQDTQALGDCIYMLVEVLRVVSIALAPFMPQTAERMREQLGLTAAGMPVRFADLLFGRTPAGLRTVKGEPLFPRIESA